MYLHNEELYVGMRCLANFKVSFDYELMYNSFVPVEIIAEYPNWWLVEVLPHRNPVRSWGVTKPYKMTIDKFNLINDLVILRSMK